jgi:aminopeptidase N
VHLKDYREPDFLIDTVDLTVELGEETTTVASRLTVRRNPKASPAAPLVLDGQSLELIALALDGEALGANRYSRTDEQLTLPDVPDAFTLDVVTRIRPGENTRLDGLYTSGGTFTTQCEAEGFRHITYFPDRPDVMARYTTTIIADEARCPVLLSNGNPAGTGKAEGGRHWARWVDPWPKPSYLFALVAGRLTAVRDTFTTRSGRHVDLAIWVRPEDAAKCGHAMESLKASMRWDEEVYGFEYDLDVFNIVAVSDFNMGAMENKGLNIFNTAYVLAKPETATDADYEGIERVIAHEYFHNWTGNRITCRDWFQLSLKEGLTVFRDEQFSAAMGSAAVRRINDVRRLKAGQFPEDAGPLAHPVRPESYIEINNFYTATVYVKGAEVVRMIHTLLGPEAWRRGMDLYVRRHDGQAVTIEDFVAAMEDASGIDLARFRRWYAQAGTPELTVTEAHDPATATFSLTFRQRTPPTPGQPLKEPLVIPFALGLLDERGAELPVRLEGDGERPAGTRVLAVTEAEHTFRFQGHERPPVPSLLRGFSAPVKLGAVPRERLFFLFSRDGDPFARWDAGQRLAGDLLLEMVAQHRGGEAMTLDGRFIDALEATLDDPRLDAAFIAEAITLPSESLIADQMEVVDPPAIHAARQEARRRIGESLAARLARAVEETREHGPHAVDASAVGRRALGNACLAYLVRAGAPGAVDLAVRQFQAGANMTDVLAALAILVNEDGAERAAALAAFYERWRGEPLVLDKWFALQAQSCLPGAIGRVRALTLHRDFTWKNPNRVRAVVGAFSAGNQLHFHAADGSGYTFLADSVITLDRLNPTMAARQLAPLGRWRRQDAARGALMRAALTRVLAIDGLSKDTFEIASKSLA